MALIITSLDVTTHTESLDVTRFGDAEPSYIPGLTTMTFTMHGLLKQADVDLLLELLKDGEIELFRKVAQCEWCGGLYPRKDLRCKRGCGGPATGVRS